MSAGAYLLLAFLVPGLNLAIYARRYRREHRPAT